MEDFKDLLVIAAGVVLGMVAVYSLIQFISYILC